ncbi:hypothetical protein DXG03_003058 [Asterophora parasitica]|uniref:Uncharacterized protein n=1 Tax=Asterophora parasitica TaxID=117018 RepID=A0A9P7K8E2_9AGAR|nr:hypothetical protein DXG03_003058 [Asterophora parasitica]
MVEERREARRRRYVTRYAPGRRCTYGLNRPVDQNVEREIEREIAAEKKEKRPRDEESVEDTKPKRRRVVCEKDESRLPVTENAQLHQVSSARWKDARKRKRDDDEEVAAHDLEPRPIKSLRRAVASALSTIVEVFLPQGEEDCRRQRHKPIDASMEKQLSEIFPMLVNVESFTLTMNYGDKNRVSFQLSPAFVADLIAMFAANGIREHNMRRAGDSLKTLNWDVRETVYDSSEVVGNYELIEPVLQSWKFISESIEALRLAFSRSLNNGVAVWEWLYDSFKQSPSHPKQLRDLTFILDADEPITESSSCDWIIDGDIIKEFGNVLAGPAFPHLRRVSVFLQCTRAKATPEEIQWNISKWKGAFRMLDEKGFLCVQWLTMEKPEMGMKVALRALEEGIQESEVHVGADGNLV